MRAVVRAHLKYYIGLPPICAHFNQFCIRPFHFISKYVLLNVTKIQFQRVLPMVYCTWKNYVVGLCHRMSLVQWLALSKGPSRGVPIILPDRERSNFRNVFILQTLDS
jgi:hypothetical protein